jgi:diazepam-binding inhibitor (GABA receptor modulator, acyl-CoA-binding protein)
MEDLTFERAVEIVNQSKTKKNTQRDTALMLQFYSLYKQATTGDCIGKRPWMYQLEAQMKYDVWYEIKGTSKEEAEEAYINLVKYTLQSENLILEV